jgi:BNR repeat protein
VRRLLLPTLLAAALLPAAAASADTVRAGAHKALLEGTPGADVLAGGKGADAVQAAFGGVDRVRCGLGRDVVDADLADRVARDCEVVARRLSVDTSTSKASQHETAVEPDSFSFGATVVAAFQLGRFEHGAASSIGTAVSTDAGRTWRRTVLPALTVESRPAGTNVRASDPSVAYDPVHGVWLVGTLALDDSASHVTVSRSPDGLHWAAPVTVATGPSLDKDWLACDGGAASAHRGRCYATYTDDLRSATVVQHSDDGGVTWSEPVRASAMLVGTQPAILPDGRLVVVAGDYVGAAGLTGAIESLVSADGGETFARARIAPLQARSGAPIRAIALPSADVDPAGRVYAVWHDCGLRPGCGGNDLVLATSTDGLSWTAPAAIRLAPGGASVSAFLPGLAADPTLAGHLGLVFAEWLPGSCPRACRVGVGFVSSLDGGLTWSAPQRLSTQPVQPQWLARSGGGRMLGDYFSTSYAAGRFVPVFALATSPLRGRLREAVFGASLPAAGPRR